MVDMDDDFVTEGLVIFTEALDDLVVSWVVEFGSRFRQFACFYFEYYQL